jgi:hypothetical protein
MGAIETGSIAEHKTRAQAIAWARVFVSGFAEPEASRIYLRPLSDQSALALWAIVVGVWAVIGAVVAGSVVGYKVCVHRDFSCVS